MGRPLEGVRVIEVAAWTFVPAAGAVMADLGAEVIKVEPPQGDPQRGLLNILNIGDGSVNPFLEVPNRGKRSITIDLSGVAGRRVLLRLCETADVFLTSYLPAVRQKLGIDVDDIRTKNPQIIYARGSGWGTTGPMSNTGGYDLAAGWATSGIANVMTLPSGEPYLQPRAFFDLIGGNGIAGAVAAALFQRERTGRAETVDVALMNVAMWALGMDIVGASQGVVQVQDRLAPENVLSNCYPTADGRWLYLVCLQSDRLWPEFCQLIERSDLTGDPRFATSENRHINRRACVSALDEVFTSRTLAEWTKAFSGFSGVWAPVLAFDEVGHHPQVAPNGFFPEIQSNDGEHSFHVVAPPQQFGGEAPVPQGPAPEVGQDTEMILLEQGYDWDQISELRAAGVLG